MGKSWKRNIFWKKLGIGVKKVADVSPAASLSEASVEEVLVVKPKSEKKVVKTKKKATKTKAKKKPVKRKTKKALKND